jgi:hypothetical protein
MKHVVKYTRDTQCTAGLSCDRIIMEYTHDEYWDMLLTVSACNSRAGTAAWAYVLCHLWQCHPDANVFRRLEQHPCETGSVTLNGTCQYRSPTDCTDIGQWRHNCSCGTRAVENLMLYFTRIETIPTRSTSWWSVASIHTSSRGVHLCFQMISSTYAILWMAVSNVCGFICNITLLCVFKFYLFVCMYCMIMTYTTSCSYLIKLWIHGML